MVLKYPTFFQHFAPEKLDAELDFTNIQHFIQVFCPKMLDVELEIAGRGAFRGRRRSIPEEKCVYLFVEIIPACLQIINN